MTKYKNSLIWFIPAFLLIVTLAPVTLPSYYYSALKIIVFIAALYVLYLLINEKPKYYLIWGLGFMLAAVAFNPIIPLSFMKDEMHFAIDAAILFVGNWVIVFKPKKENLDK